MTAFTYKGYGRIYTNPENINEVENIIKELDEFEWSYYPGGLVTSWDRYPNIEYVGKFELDENKFKEICKERNIPVFIFDNGTEYENYGYSKTLNKEEIKTLSYGELKELMNYETFYKNFLSSYCEDGVLRVGQLFMNELYKYNPELYKKLPADLDCYYDNKLFGACSDWVQDRWEN